MFTIVRTVIFSLKNILENTATEIKDNDEVKIVQTMMFMYLKMYIDVKVRAFPIKSVVIA